VTKKLLSSAFAAPVLHSLREGRLVPFCGAGISYNAGLPVVLGKEGLLPTLLGSLGLTQDTQDRILRNKPPFELLMGTVARALDLDPLILMFRLGKPALAHTVLAQLCGKHLVRVLITTNFDLLLERALAEARVDYQRIVADADYSRFSADAKCSLVKLHGSADDARSVAITLDRIAHRQLEQSRTELLHFLTSVRSNVLCFLGYSFSDSFDIVPAFKSSPLLSAPAILVSHRDSGDASWVDLSHLPIDGVLQNSTEEVFARIFGGCDGSAIIRCKSDEFLAEIASTFLGRKQDSFPQKEGPVSWRSQVDRWSSRLSLQDKKAIRASLLAEVVELDQALREVGNSHPGEGDNRLMGAILHRKGQFNDAIRHYRLALQRESDIPLAANTRNNLARLLSNTGRTAEAIELYETNLAENLSPIGRVQALRGLAGTLLAQGDADRARQLAEEAMCLAIDTNDLKEEAYCCAVFAQTLVGVKARWTEIKQLLARAHELGSLMGDRGLLLMAHEVEGNWRQFEGRVDLAVDGASAASVALEESLSAYNDALTLAQVIGDRAAVARLTWKTGNSMTGLASRKQESVELMGRAAAIAHEVGNYELEALALQACGEVLWTQLDCYSDALRFLRGSLRVAEHNEVSVRLTIVILTHYSAALSLSGDINWKARLLEVVGRFPKLSEASAALCTAQAEMLLAAHQKAERRSP